MIKQNLRCYACVYCSTCDKEQEEKCANMNYTLFATENDIRMCELMGCGDIQEDED